MIAIDRERAYGSLHFATITPMSLFGALCWLTFLVVLALIGERGQRGFMLWSLIVINVTSAGLLVFF